MWTELFLPCTWFSARTPIFIVGAISFFSIWYTRRWRRLLLPAWTRELGGGDRSRLAQPSRGATVAEATTPLYVAGSTASLLPAAWSPSKTLHHFDFSDKASSVFTALWLSVCVCAVIPRLTQLVLKLVDGFSPLNKGLFCLLRWGFSNFTFLLNYLAENLELILK